MKVRVKLHSCFSFLSGGKGGVEDLELNDGSSVLDIIEHYSIQPGYIAAILINKGMAQDDSKVKENDLVEILPVFGGG